MIETTDEVRDVTEEFMANGKKKSTIEERVTLHITDSKSYKIKSL